MRNYLCAALLLVSAALVAGDATPADGPFNVALSRLGATIKGSGVYFNPDWPAYRALEGNGGGTLFGAPLTGGRVDISLIIPVDLVAVELVGLDYGGTVQAKNVDIFVDGKLAKQAELPETPGQPIRIPLAAKGQTVGVLVTGEHPLRNGGKGPNYGGWAVVRVFSSTNLPHLMRAVDGHAVVRSDSSIAPTSGAAVAGKVEVFGKPRQSKGHPCTVWDSEDVEHYKAMLKTSTDLQTQFTGLKTSLDLRLTQVVGVPAPRKNAAGQWLHISDQELQDGRQVGAIHNQLSLDVANLGQVYALTGEAKYAEFAKRILLAYGEAYPNYAQGSRPGFNHSPSKAFDQVHGDTVWVIPLARGYDLIHDLPSITPEERKLIEQGLFGQVAALTLSSTGMWQGSANWSAIGTCALLTIGYAIDDQSLVQAAKYGRGGTAEKPTGGLFDRQFSALAIRDDGIWHEGSMSYQFMALEALVADAEILWHHGIDLYSYRDAALKRVFDSPLQMCYPGLSTPALEDAYHGSLLGNESFLYEFAYRRYRDPAYLLVLNQVGRHFATAFQQYPVSVLYDRDLTEKTKAVEWKSVNFFQTGYGILRQTTAAGTNSLLLDFGQPASHGHPDKLNLDLFAFNDRLMPDPGCIWYEQPLYRQWYRTTLAHNTVVVDEVDQIMAGANQVVYGAGLSLGMQRAWTADATPGVLLDRAVFLTPDYMADLYGAFGRLPRTIDLAWHIIGDFTSPLTLEAKPFPQPAGNGYCALTNVRRAITDQPWSASLTRNGNTARFHAAGGTPTEVIVADGPLGIGTVPTIIERRKVGSTIYGNALDISEAKDGYVKAVRQAGGLEAGFGLLEVQTMRGTDVCFSAFRPGTYKAAGLESDAQQAFALRDGTNVRALFLGGGTRLIVDGTSLQRSEPGLACLERTDSGAFILANPSAHAATITVDHPALAGMQAYVLDSQGRRGAAAAIAKGKGSALQVALSPSAQVEFAPAGVASMYEIRQALLAKRQAELEATLTKERNACQERTTRSESEAKAKPVPANTIVAVNATAFSAQGGGAVKIAPSKRGAVGKAFSHWDGLGHWLEWKITAPAEGYYNLTICYSSALDLMERVIAINGEVQEPMAPMILPGTGGWSDGSDDWRLATALNPLTKKPLLLKFKQGENIVRLTNSNGRAVNLNYLAITTPELAITRELLGAKVPVESPAPTP